VSKLGHSLAILDVGHGNCAVLIDTNGVVVIDTGPGSSLLEYLTERGIKIVDVVLISHADQDHIGGLIQLLASKVFCIKRVLLNTDSEKDSAVWDDLLYELNRANNANELQFEISLTHNRSGEFDQGAVNIEILGPSKYLAGKGPGSKDKKGRKITTNSISAVIRLSKDKNPIALLPGDLDEVGLTDLIGSGVNLNAPLVVFPHHGGRAGSTNMTEFARKLCAQVSPKMVIFSNGRGQRGTPIPEVVEAIRQRVPFIRIACTQLSEHCAKSLPPSLFTHLNNVFSAGRESNKCCAGTIVIALDSVDTIFPDYDAHQEFIKLAAPTALCRA